MDTTYKLTQPGYDKILKELAELKEVKRPEAVVRLKRAREMGDLSENSEYAASKEDLAFTDGRIQEIEAIINNSEIITEEASDHKTVNIGNTVVVEVNGAKTTFTVVGELEGDIMHNKISDTSPIGKALLGSKVGTKVSVETPGGMVQYAIVEIK